MKNAIRLFAAAVLVGMSLGAAGAATTGTFDQSSPTGTYLVSWPVNGTVLTFFNVETKQSATYNVGFPVVGIHFSMTERYLCIAGSARVIVIDRGNANHTVINLPSPANTSVSCAMAGGGINSIANDQYPRSSADTVANRTISILLRSDKVIPCGTATTTATDFTTKFYDPKAPAAPYRQYLQRLVICQP